LLDKEYVRIVIYNLRSCYIRDLTRSTKHEERKKIEVLVRLRNSVIAFFNRGIAVLTNIVVQPAPIAARIKRSQRQRVIEAELRKKEIDKWIEESW